MNRVRAIAFAYKLVTAAAGFAVHGAILKVLPWFDQKNGFFVLFFVPFWLGAAYGIRALRDYTSAVVEQAVGKTPTKTDDVKTDVDGDVEVKKPKKKKAKPKASTEAVTEKPGVAETKTEADAGATPEAPAEEVDPKPALPSA